MYCASSSRSSGSRVATSGDAEGASALSSVMSLRTRRWSQLQRDRGLWQPERVDSWQGGADARHELSVVTGLLLAHPTVGIGALQLAQHRHLVPPLQAERIAILIQAVEPLRQRRDLSSEDPQ